MVPLKLDLDLQIAFYKMKVLRRVRCTEFQLFSVIHKQRFWGWLDQGYFFKLNIGICWSTFTDINWLKD